MPDKTKEAMRDFKTKYLCRPVEEAIVFARVCKLGKCWKTELTKVYISFADPEATYAITTAMKPIRGDIKYGRLPPEGLEQKIRKNLDNIQ